VAQRQSGFARVWAPAWHFGIGGRLCCADSRAGQRCDLLWSAPMVGGETVSVGAVGPGVRLCADRVARLMVGSGMPLLRPGGRQVRGGYGTGAGGESAKMESKYAALVGAVRVEEWGRPPSLGRRWTTAVGARACVVPPAASPRAGSSSRQVGRAGVRPYSRQPQGRGRGPRTGYSAHAGSGQAMMWLCHEPSGGGRLRPVTGRFIGTNVRVSLRADEVWVFDRSEIVVCHPRLAGRYGFRDLLDHYLEILRHKPGALEHSTGLAAARASGQFTATHDAFWAAAIDSRCRAEGTRALIEVLLLHRRLPDDAVVAGMKAVLEVGSIAPDLVAIEARKAVAAAGGPPPVGIAPQTVAPVAAEPDTAELAEPQSDSAQILSLPQRRPALPPDSRPEPSLAAYGPCGPSRRCTGRWPPIRRCPG
jgi:hypothetical protein